MQNDNKRVGQFLIEAQERRLGRHLHDFEMDNLRKSTSYKLLSWLETILKLKMPAPDVSLKEPNTSILYKTNILVQAIFGLFSLAIVTLVIMTIMEGLRGNLILLKYSLTAILLLTLLLSVKNLLSVWSHLTLQFILTSVSILPLANLSSLKGWHAFASMVPWPVRLAAYIIPALIAISLAAKLCEFALRVRCPIGKCHGWCKRQGIYPVTFICASCNTEYRTTIYIKGRG